MYFVGHGMKVTASTAKSAQTKGCAIAKKPVRSSAKTNEEENMLDNAIKARLAYVLSRDKPLPPGLEDMYGNLMAKEARTLAGKKPKRVKNYKGQSRYTDFPLEKALAYMSEPRTVHEIANHVMYSVAATHYHLAAMLKQKQISVTQNQQAKPWLYQVGDGTIYGARTVDVLIDEKLCEEWMTAREFAEGEGVRTGTILGKLNDLVSAGKAEVRKIVQRGSWTNQYRKVINE